MLFHKKTKETLLWPIENDMLCTSLRKYWTEQAIDNFAIFISKCPANICMNDISSA